MRIDHYVLGYRKISVSQSDRGRTLNALIKRGMSCKMDSGGSFSVFAVASKRYENALHGVEYSTSEILGAPAFFLKYQRRIGIIIGFLISFVYILLSSASVWDIRIEGNESVSNAAIESELADAGLAVGGSWLGINTSKIETELLLSSSDIGWVNVNRRGNVAYVTVREKREVFTDEEKGYFSNVVATADCVISEITVKKGIACVKVGETVKEGQLLISGVIPDELGGGFVAAEGEIFGAVNEKIELTVPPEESKSELSEAEISEISVKIFNFSIKLFKKYRKSDKACAIIEDVREGVLFGKHRIPFGIRTIYVSEKTEKTEIYTEKQMTEIAAQRLSAVRRSRFSDADLLKLKTTGEFSDKGYTVTTYATVQRSVGEEKAFSVETSSSP